MRTANHLAGQLEVDMGLLTDQQRKRAEQDRILATELMNNRSGIRSTQDHLLAEAPRINQDMRLTQNQIQTESTGSVTRDEYLNQKTEQLHQRVTAKDNRKYWDTYPSNCDWWAPQVEPVWYHAPTVARDSSHFSIGRNMGVETEKEKWIIPHPSTLT